MAKYKVEKKYVVVGGWSEEMKTFRDESDAKEYAMMLNDVYQAGINYAVKNPNKVEASTDY